MMGYKAALRWLCDNDDMFWLDDTDFGSPSVTTTLVADIYEHDIEKVVADVRALRNNLKNGIDPLVLAEQRLTKKLQAVAARIKNKTATEEDIRFLSNRRLSE